jgi:predicted TIM-barrel fold metal-dependent hydrolase
MAYPEAAAEELERCVNELGFLGALVDNHLNNMTFYDSTEYDPFWATAQRLEVPIYLHPTYSPGKDVRKPGGRETPSHGDYSEVVAAALSAHGFGWHVDTGLNFLRLWLGGVFDRFPHVKIILGHMGETIPYMLDRADAAMGSFKTEGVTVKDAWAKNIWVTTSGFFSVDPFSTLQRTTSSDRILVSIGLLRSLLAIGMSWSLTAVQFSVDYPWSTNENGIAFMEELKTNGMVSKAEWEKIAFKNAIELLKL